MKIKSVLLATFVSSLAFCSSLRAVIIDNINGALAPSGYTWGANEVGFQYTPGFSYSLDGVLTNFGYTDGRSVGLEIHASSPTGTLLASTSFVAGSGWTGGYFSSVSLSGGSTYYIDFTNVTGLGANIVNGGTITPYYWGVNNGYPNFYAGFGGLLKFDSGSSVPEAGETLVLLAGACAALVCVGRKLRTKA